MAFKYPQTPSTVKNTLTSLFTDVGIFVTSSVTVATAAVTLAPEAAAVVGAVAGPLMFLSSPTNPFNPRDMFHKYGTAVSFLRDAFRDKDKKAIALLATTSLIGAIGMGMAADHINAEQAKPQTPITTKTMTAPTVRAAL